MSVTAELVSADRLRVVVKINRIDSALRASRWTTWVAVVESELTTPVGRGENASKTLRNDRVVRRLERVSGLEPMRGGASGSLEFVVEDSWRRDKLSVVAFLQETDSLRVRAAAESVPAR